MVFSNPCRIIRHRQTTLNTGYPVADDQIVVEIDSPNPDEVISNMEGGQYAKTENLLRTKEPETFDAIKYGTTAETSTATMTALLIMQTRRSPRMVESVYPCVCPYC